MFARSSRRQRRRSKSRDRRPRAGLFSSGIPPFRRGSSKNNDRHNDEEEVDPVSSSSTDESETFHDAKVRAENLEDYEPSELVHGLISESSSRDTLSSEEETVGEQSMEQSVEQSVVYVESVEDDEPVGGILQMGCMDGFFMPGRAAASKKSLIELNEKGEKELKFDMKLPIAMGFQKEEQKKQNQKRSDADGRSATPSIASVLNCRPNDCRNDHDIHDALEGLSVSSIRHQTTMDPPAKVAGGDPSEQFKSLMSLSHDASSNDDDSRSNIRGDNSNLPSPPPPQPYGMHGQSPYMQQHGHRHSMMQQGGPPMHQWHHYHQNNMMYPPHQPPPVTVNNTYEMLVVNGMMPQQQQQLAYWNYMQQQALGQQHHHRPMEPPAIEKLPSQILVQKEDQTLGEDSSCLSYENNVPAPSHGTATYQEMLYQRVVEQQSSTKHHFGARVLQSSHQYPHINAIHGGQSAMMQSSLPLKNGAHTAQNHSYKAAVGNQRRISASASRSSSEESSRNNESDDDFQDSVQVMPEDQITSSSSSRPPKSDEKSHSSGEGGRIPLVNRWRQANLRRLRGASPSPPTASAGSPLVATIPSAGSRGANPSFDEAPCRQTSLGEEASVASSKGMDMIDDDGTVDSEMAIVDTKELTKKPVKPKSGRLQPVEEEDSNNPSDDGSTDSESTASDESSSSEESSTASSVQSAPSLQQDEHKEVSDCIEEAPAKKHPVKEETQEMQANNNTASTNEPSEPTQPSSLLMFDSIYTRRRERRDAAKMKMNTFLASKREEKNDAKVEEKLAGKRSTTRMSRLSRLMSQGSHGSGSNDPKSDSKSGSPTSQERFEDQMTQQNSLTATPLRGNKTVIPPPAITATPLRGNKTVIPPPAIETVDSIDAVLRPLLDVPGLNSPNKRPIRGPESPSKRVSMSPLAHSSSIDHSSGIKMSLSLKPTMTSEFHDAMSTASDEIFTNCDQSLLRIQPTMTSEWHDAVDTVQSPSATSILGSKQQHSSMKTTEEFKLGDEPPASTPHEVSSVKVTKSSSSDGSSYASTSLKKRSIDHDDDFEATCVVD